MFLMKFFTCAVEPRLEMMENVSFEFRPFSCVIINTCWIYRRRAESRLFVSNNAQYESPGRD